jgi:hypothetical protein
VQLVRIASMENSVATKLILFISIFSCSNFWCKDKKGRIIPPKIGDRNQEKGLKYPLRDDFPTSRDEMNRKLSLTLSVL